MSHTTVNSLDRDALSDGYLEVEKRGKRVAYIIVNPKDYVMVSSGKGGFKEQLDPKSPGLWAAQIISSSDVQVGTARLYAH